MSNGSEHLDGYEVPSGFPKTQEEAQEMAEKVLASGQRAHVIIRGSEHTPERDDYTTLIEQVRRQGDMGHLLWSRELFDAVEVQRSRIAALEAVIEKVRARGEFLVRVSDPSKYAPASPARVMSVDGQRFGEEMIEMASAAPSTVLDQMIREAKAEALDAMTTEWGWRHSQGIRECRSEREAREYYESGLRSDERRQHAYRGKNAVVSRLVGPWTPVEGDA